MTHAYWGPEFDDREIAALLDSKKAALDSASCSVRHLTDEAERSVREVDDVRPSDEELENPKSPFVDQWLAAAELRRAIEAAD